MVAVNNLQTSHDQLINQVSSLTKTIESMQLKFIQKINDHQTKTQQKSGERNFNGYFNSDSNKNMQPGGQVRLRNVKDKQSLSVLLQQSDKESNPAVIDSVLTYTERRNANTTL